MKLILSLFCFTIIVVATNCGSSNSSIGYDKIESIKMDSLNYSAILQHSKIPTVYKFIRFRGFPKTDIYIINFDLLDSNKQIISATPIGGERAITMKIAYPELAKRADIEGTVWCEFKVDKNGNAKDIKILKDIGGGCGNEVYNSILKSKFNPGMKLKNKIESNYRIAIQFKILPVNKE